MKGSKGAFRMGAARGCKFRSSSLNKQTNWTGGALYHKRDVAANRSFGISTNPEDGEKRFSLELLSAMVDYAVQADPKREGPAKRQDAMVESSELRKIRVYRRCSQDCKPNPKGGFGCQGWKRWGSCPQPSEDEKSDSKKDNAVSSSGKKFNWGFNKDNDPNF